MTVGDSLIKRACKMGFGAILADPPWRFQNRTGKIAPEHRRLARYGTLTIDDICGLPVAQLAAATSHLYLWAPNALLPQGLRVMAEWGFTYKTNIVWHKIRKDGGPDGRGVGFYFRNTTELVLFGIRGKDARTLPPGRRQVNILKTMKREHSRKPDELYELIENCSNGPFLEMFARGARKGWTAWGNQAEDYYPSWPTYANHSRNGRENIGKTSASVGLPNKTLPKICIDPMAFIDAALRPAPGHSLGAGAAYSEYKRHCAASCATPVEKFSFWRMLSQKASSLGIDKEKTKGRVFYANLTLAPVS